MLPVSIDGVPWRDHHLSRGLGFFHTFMKASQKDKLHLLRNDSYDFAYSSLSRVLEEKGPEWDNPMYDAWENQAFQGFHGDDDRDGPNAAWPWSTENKVEIRYYQSDKEGLRKWAYVMWDKERLDQWAILKENPHDYFME